MKKVPKSTLDSFIFIARLRLEEDTDFEELTSQLYGFATFLERQTNVHWMVWTDFINSIFGTDGLKTNATNDEIYVILHLLGWEVVDEKIGNNNRNKC